MSASSESDPDLQRETAALAHEIWKAEGCPEGQSVQHWERAEREMRSRFGDSPLDAQSPGGIPNDTGASGKMG